jgi:hypothetical protein
VAVRTGARWRRRRVQRGCCHRRRCCHQWVEKEGHTDLSPRRAVVSSSGGGGVRTLLALAPALLLSSSSVSGVVRDGGGVPVPPHFPLPPLSSSSVNKVVRDGGGVPVPPRSLLVPCFLVALVVISWGWRRGGGTYLARWPCPVCCRASDETVAAATWPPTRWQRSW